MRNGPQTTRREEDDPESLPSWWTPCTRIGHLAGSRPTRPRWKLTGLGVFTNPLLTAPGPQLEAQKEPEVGPCSVSDVMALDRDSFVASGA